MVWQSERGRWIPAGASAAAGWRAVWLVWFVGCCRAMAAEGVDKTIEACLEAGEFGPALAVAGALEDGGLRDHWLGRIAAAQAGTGAGRASLSTLSAMHSDVARSRALEDLRSRPLGAAGGAAMADFDTLIELIRSTIAPNSWDELGGAGAIESYPTGVYVDASGVLRQLGPARDTYALDILRRSAARDSGNRAVSRSSALRKVSLVRLEKQLQLRQAFGRTPDEAMRMLAGLHRIRHVFVYPELGDIVVAGPAGDWHTDAEGRAVNSDTGDPVLQLDDLIVLLRNAYEENGRFGCAIKPRQENLAAFKAYAEARRDSPLKTSQREQWLADLRDAVGKQDIEVWGVDPRSRVARIVIEADYRMKLVGMGLEEGTLGVVSYLKRSPETPPAMSVLRWWFTLAYDGVVATPQRDAFQFKGKGVRVLSENELLSETGQRIHTGTSEELNLQFAHSFTRHFDALADKYPVYAELRNVFDLAMVASLMRAEDLPGQVDWHMTHFRNPRACPVALGPTPREVESVINSVVVDPRRIVAGVSGGVSVDVGELVKADAITIDDYGLMDATRASAGADLPAIPPDAWWWD